jgi:hypothetical protein
MAIFPNNFLEPPSLLAAPFPTLGPVYIPCGLLPLWKSLGSGSNMLVMALLLSASVFAWSLTGLNESMDM